nr:hypothetical protein HK105_006542 [Polyrhizophydium stewartii]
MDAVKGGLELAQSAAGPLGVVFQLALLIMNTVDQTQSSNKALRTLARRCDLLANELNNRISGAYGTTSKGRADIPPDVRRNIAAVESLLADIERFAKKNAARTPLQQALRCQKTAETIQDFNLQLTGLTQTLGLSLSIDQSAVTIAIQEDLASLPALLESLTATVDTKFTVQSQRLDTLMAINNHQAEMLAALPQQFRELKSHLEKLLENTKADIVSKSGRGLSAAREYTTDPDDVDVFLDQLVGEGGFGRIYRGIWKNRAVAVKVLNGVAGADAISMIEKETKVWFPLRHPNVLPLLCVCLNTDQPYIVMPLMGSDLTHYISTHPDTPLPIRVGFLLGIARGMQYLHGLPQPIIHGDLKANNVLISATGDVQITDFGMAFVRTMSVSNTKRRTGAVRWIAPEKYRRGYAPIPASDVFAFAMTAYQVLTGTVPFNEESADDIVKEWIKDGERPDKHANIPDDLWQIIEDCWAQDPNQRPTFARVAQALDAMATDKPSDVEVLSTREILAQQVGMPKQFHFDSGIGGSIPPPGSIGAAHANARPAVNVQASPRHDISILLEAFPEWCQAKGITATSWRGHAATSRVWDDSAQRFVARPQLEWDANERLVALRLGSQGISGQLPTQLFELTGLTELDLDGNKLSGPIPSQIGSLTKLRALYLSNNSFNWPLPDEIGRLTELRKLGLHNNIINGNIPATIGSLVNLEYLSLSQNRLSGEIPEQIGNMKNLRLLYLHTNDLTGLIPASIGQLANLTHFCPAGNHLIGSIPASIGNLTKLEILDLSENQLSGHIPLPLFGLAKLTELYLSGNKLSGPVPSQIAGLPSIRKLYLNNNSLEGTIPGEVGRLALLSELSMNANNLQGPIPPEIAGLRELRELSLANNSLTGSIPIELCSLSQLRILYLTKNKFSGSLPPHIGNLISLTELGLSHNQISGSLPDTIGNLTNVTILLLNNNLLSGNLSPYLGNLFKLTELDLSSNKFVGSVPPHLGNLVQLKRL